MKHMPRPLGAINFAHNLLLGVLMDQDLADQVIDCRERALVEDAVVVLCWVLGHDVQGDSNQMQLLLNDVAKRLEALGKRPEDYVFLSKPEPTHRLQ